MSIVFLSKFRIYHTREMVLFHEFFFFFTSFYNQIDALFSDALFRQPYKKSGTRRFGVHRYILRYFLKTIILILYTKFSSQFHTPLSSASTAIRLVSTTCMLSEIPPPLSTLPIFLPYCPVPFALI